jgi:hypothetical protein
LKLVTVGSTTLLEFLIPLKNYFVHMWFLCGTWSETSIAPSKLTEFFANSKTQNAFLSPHLAMFHHDCSLEVKPASTPWRLLSKQTWRDSLPIDMLLSAVSVLVVALLSLEVLEGLMNYPVFGE